jgi:hypothetical protein
MFKIEAEDQEAVISEFLAPWQGVLYHASTYDVDIGISLVEAVKETGDISRAAALWRNQVIADETGKWIDVGAKVMADYETWSASRAKNYVIYKHGMGFYSSNRSGYTNSLDIAGRYTKKEAVKEANVEPLVFSVFEVVADPLATAIKCKDFIRINEGLAIGIGFNSEVRILSSTMDGSVAWHTIDRSNIAAKALMDMAYSS